MKELRIVIAAPYDHLRACPYGAVVPTRRRSIDRTHGSPLPRNRVVCAPALDDGAIGVDTPPDQHLLPGPYGCRQCSRFGRSLHRQPFPFAGCGVICRPVGTCRKEVTAPPSPNEQLTASPNADVKPSSRRERAWRYGRPLALARFVTRPVTSVGTSPPDEERRSSLDAEHIVAGRGASTAYRAPVPDAQNLLRCGGISPATEGPCASSDETKRSDAPHPSVVAFHSHNFTKVATLRNENPDRCSMDMKRLALCIDIRLATTMANTGDINSTGVRRPRTHRAMRALSKRCQLEHQVVHPSAPSREQRAPSA
jgi:hypothetical protein